MSCLDLQITKPLGSSLTLQKCTLLGLSLGRPNPAVLQVAQSGALRLTVGEVCGVSGGTLVVLAAQDGPLRTKNGGYLLLNPATNPPEP
ncbi:MAG: hypothetical protein J5732_03000 [Bacteroidaceae bacterium]|nr:hypothetical protein [Bacteroidaceae bacterium]